MNYMPYRKIGNIEVSPIGMGFADWNGLRRLICRLEWASPIGMGCMGFSHGYGEVPEE